MVHCSICLTAFAADDGKDAMSTPCGHIFHKHCLHGWIQSSNMLYGMQPMPIAKCPLCRTVFPTSGLLKVYLSFPAADPPTPPAVVVKNERTTPPAAAAAEKPPEQPAVAQRRVIRAVRGRRQPRQATQTTQISTKTTRHHTYTYRI